MSLSVFLRSLPFTLLCACALEVGDGGPSGSASAALSARDEVLKLTLDAPARDEAGVVLRGRTSVPLASAMAFVPDDEVGRTELANGGFETHLPLQEVKARLTGSPLFLVLRSEAGAQTHARLALAVELPARCSNAKVKLTKDTQSALVDGASVLRLGGTTSLAGARIEATLGGDGFARPVFRATRRAERFTLDVPLDVAAAAAVTATPLVFTVTSGDTTVTRTCTPALVIKGLTLSSGDPYEVWPAPSCDDATRSCLAQKSHRGDTATCGDIAHVRACGARPMPESCGRSLATRLGRTTQGSLWTSETDAPFAPVVLAADPSLSAADALRAAYGQEDDVVETRPLADVLSWPTGDRPEEGPSARLQAAVYRALADQLNAYLDDVQVVRIGTIRIDVYFVGRDACGNLVGLKTLAVET